MLAMRTMCAHHSLDPTDSGEDDMRGEASVMF